MQLPGCSEILVYVVLIYSLFTVYSETQYILVLQIRVILGFRKRAIFIQKT